MALRVLWSVKAEGIPEAELVKDPKMGTIKNRTIITLKTSDIMMKGDFCFIQANLFPLVPKLS
jgi:hypothetical protein